MGVCSACVRACVRNVHLLVVCYLVWASVFVSSGCSYERLCERQRFELFRANEIQRHRNSVIIIVVVIIMLRILIII